MINLATNQATQSDRVKIYVNGVQETSFSTATYPSQDTALQINKTVEICRIGGDSSGGNTFGGSMSALYWVAGSTGSYAGTLPVSTFGETDTDTGEWRPKNSPSITAYGDNGFFMKFEDSSNIDLDSSTNNYTFTAIAPAITQTKDCPNNVFAAWNILSTVSYKQSAGGYLSFLNGNTRIYENGGAYKNAPSTLGAFTGKYYFETKMISPNGSLAESTYVGVITAGDVQNIGDNYNYVGQTANSVAYNSYAGQVFTSGSGTSYGASLANGDILGVALDITNLKVYFSKNGVWQNSGDPTSGSTGTGAVSLPSTGDSWLFGGSPRNSSIESNFGNGFFGTTAVADNSTTPASTPGTFNYDVPSGYQPLSTKGLNA